MSPMAIAVLSFSMSIDAMVAAIGRGASIGRPGFLLALKTGAIFGTVETITPLLGWLAGVAASRYVAAIDHWIAFALLSFVGGRMIWHAIHGHGQKEDRQRNGSLLVLIAIAVGTSIDAMVVGVSLAFLDINIVLVALAIGIATFIMSTVGMLAGHAIGARVGIGAEILGGMALAGLGLLILVQHLTA